jgi:hypothetical protein
MMDGASFFCENHIILGFVRNYMTFLIIITPPIANQRVIYKKKSYKFAYLLKLYDVMKK